MDLQSVDELASKIQIQAGKKLKFLPDFMIFRPLLVDNTYI